MRSRNIRSVLLTLLVAPSRAFFVHHPTQKLRQHAWFSLLDTSSAQRKTTRSKEGVPVSVQRESSSTENETIEDRIINNLSDASFPDDPTTTDATAAASLDFPWSESQEWALRDQLPKFTIQVVVDDKLCRFVLWRNLVQSTPELAGYPLSFLADHVASSSNAADATSPLPYLDAFQFEPSGGVSGYVYGVSGVADGTRIQTTPVGHVRETIPYSYIQTGSVVYELGEPIDTTTASGMAVPPSSVINSKNTVEGRMATKLPTDFGGLMSLDPEIVNLAGLTATVIAGAWALESISHHLTVNVFWV